MTREEAHKLVDQLFDNTNGYEEELMTLDTSMLGNIEQFSAETRVPELPEGRRVVRTKTSGDRVYFLDDDKKTRQWATNPEVVDSLGFTLADVVEVEEDELLKYQMGPAIYKRVDEA